MSGLHQPTGRWKLGFALAAFTSLCWGGLPVALKAVLRELDPVTLSWFRFSVAGLFMLGWLTARGRLPRFSGRSRKTWGLIAVVCFGLAANYVFFQLGIPMTGAGPAQVIIQLSPVMFLVGSVVIFKERMSGKQWLGLAVTLVGFALFFLSGAHDAPTGGGDIFVAGLAWVMLSGIAWAAYALAQKQLLMSFSSAQVMATVYIASALMLTPFANIARIAQMPPALVAILIAAAANTIFAYGAFAESLAHWEGSRVSAVLSLTPILTLGFAAVAGHLWPTLVGVENLSGVSYLAAALVVVGSLATSLAKSR